MKLKVLKSFVDKENGKFYNVGETIEVSDKRAKEILSHPLEIAEKIAEDVVTEPKPQRKKKED